MRALTSQVYKTYFIESDNQSEAYFELAMFAFKNPDCLIEAVAPGYYSEDGHVYTLTVTVSQ